MWVHLLALQDGPLRHRFEQVCDVTVLDRYRCGALGVAQQGLLHFGSSRAWKRSGSSQPQLRRFDGYDLVYSNSIASSVCSPTCHPPGDRQSRPRAAGRAAHVATSMEFLDAFDQRSDAWIAASGAVRDLLVDERGFRRRPGAAAPRVHRRPRASPRAGAAPGDRAPPRDLGIPADAAVVVGAGTIDWRKGADLFVQLAAEVRRQTREPVSFVWVGGDLVGTDWERVRSDIERTGSDHVHFVGVKPTRSPGSPWPMSSR